MLESQGTSYALATMDDVAGFSQQRASEATGIYRPAGISGLASKTLDDAMVRAGLDFPVEAAPLYQQIGGSMTGAGDYVGVRNARTGRIFTTAKSGYQPLQWGSAHILDPLVEQGHGVYDGALKLRSGAVGVARVKLSHVIRVRGDGSPINGFLQVVVPHDGTLTWGAYLSTVRAVCENTLAMGLAEAKANGQILKIKHTKTAEQRVAQAGLVLERAVRELKVQEEWANMMAGVQLRPQLVGEVVGRLLPVTKVDAAGQDKVTARLTAARETLTSLFESGSGINGAMRGSAWAMVNAVTEFADHHTVLRDTSPAARANSVLFGTAAKMKARAVEIITDVVGELVA